MRELFLSSILCLFFSLSLAGQSDELLQFNQQGQTKQKRAMMVLGGWAVGNIAIGAALRGQHQGVERSFHDMNIGWNLVNLGIATLGYIGASKTDPAAMSLFESVQGHHGFQKTLLFNAGLDVGYMLGGLYLMERSKNATKNQDRLKGFGKSITLQGGFLFVFDLLNYFIFAGDNVELKPLMGMDITGGQQVGVLMRF